MILFWVHLPGKDTIHSAPLRCLVSAICHKACFHPVVPGKIFFLNLLHNEQISLGFILYVRSRISIHMEIHNSTIYTSCLVQNSLFFVGSPDLKDPPWPKSINFWIWVWLSWRERRVPVILLRIIIIIIDIQRRSLHRKKQKVSPFNSTSISQWTKKAEQFTGKFSSLR